MGGWRTIGPFATNTSFSRKAISSPLNCIRSPRGTRLFAFRLVVGLYLWGSAGVFLFLARIGGVLGFVVLIMLDI